MSKTAQEFEPESSLVTIQYRDNSTMRDVYGYANSAGNVSLDGVLITPKGRPAKTLLMYMHPSSMIHLLPLPKVLVKAGAHVLCAGSRYYRNDAPLVMEKVVRDYAEYVRHAKENLGYEKVVVAGWSGGGSLTAFYQSQAERPTIDVTPAGDPIDLAGMIPGDAMIFHAAHLSRAQVLLDFLDPSVLDEADPTLREAEFDLYSSRNPNRPPYSSEYIAHFRARQLARMRRRTALVKELLDVLRSGRTSEIERALLFHRTLADPRFLDGSIDPNDRRIGWCFLGDPEASNSSPAGIARFSTLRAWLSQWSIDDTNAHAAKHAGNISVPLLAIENSADDAVPAPHTREFFNAYSGADKTYQVVNGANHYYHEQPAELTSTVELIVRWLSQHNLMN